MARSDHYTDTAECSSLPGLQNERGVALITVLIVLMLLCILGATVLSSSTSDLRIAGNYRNMQRAFFSADAAVEFATTYGAIYTSIVPGGTSSWPAPGAGKVLDENGVSTGTASPDTNYNVMPIGGGTAKVKVDYIETGAVPAGTGSEVDVGLGSGAGFKANYYNVSVNATGPNDTQAEIDSYIARIIPK